MQIDIFANKRRLRIFKEGGIMETAATQAHARVTHPCGVTEWNAVPHEYMTDDELRAWLEEAKRAIDARLANL